MKMVKRYKLLLLLLFCALSFIPAHAVSAGEPLRKKIGQMLIVGFSGTDLFDGSASMDTLKVDLQERNLGGVLEFAYNLKSPVQMKTLSGQLNQLASFPLFISTDQEGGKVARLGSANGFQATNSAYSLGTLIDREDSTRATAAMMAGWLAQSGINMDFAPVTDVLVNPKSPVIAGLNRSFSKSPLKVAEHAGYFINELHKKNIISTLKHFPGHGSALTDSHLGFTDITKTWADSELVPYRQLIAKGLVDVIMTGHLFNANLDTLPATLSPKVINGLLRRDLGYNGVVVSDEMSMKAISSNYGFYEAASLAINAGVDILLYNSNLLTTNNSLVRSLIDYIEKKVLDGTIPESRIDESYQRIMNLKGRYMVPSGVAMRDDSVLPGSFRLEGYPNPFNSSINLRVIIPFEGRTSLKIYDIMGREVATVMEGEKQPGVYTLNWDAKDNSSGVYFATLRSGSTLKTSKIVLLK